jgi:hypothetical protein
MIQISFKHITKTALVFCIIFFSSWNPGFSDTSQAWLKNSITFTLSSKWDLKIAHETRNLDISFFNPYYKNIAGGFVFHFPKNFYFSAVYKRVHVEFQDTIYNENRYILEAGWETPVANKLDFDLRFRTEIREFEEEFPEDHLRFRLRLMLVSQINLGKLELMPFIANETLGKSKIYTVQKNRFYIGTMIPLGEHVKFNISYMWLATQGAESIHILYSGFNLEF